MKSWGTCIVKCGPVGYCLCVLSLQKFSSRYIFLNSSMHLYEDSSMNIRHSSWVYL